MKLEHVIALSVCGAFCGGLLPVRAEAAVRAQSAVKTLPADKLKAAAPEAAPALAKPQIQKPKPFETAYPPYAGQGKDITSAYQSAWQEAEKPLTPQEADVLGRYKILLVPGFLGNLASGPGPLVQVHLPGLNVDVGRMFDLQMQWLTKHGLQFEYVQIETEAAPYVNAKIIASRIAASERPVILIGHSKGGVDSLYALVDNPQLAGKVAAFISMQSPFLGSPVADEVMSSRSLNGLSQRILSNLGGKKASLVSLTTRYALAYYGKKQKDIARVQGTVRVINFCSWKNEVPGRVDTVLEPLRDGMAAVGLQNDGLVPVQSQMLPGGSYVKVEGLDHLGPVMDNSVLKVDQVRFFRTMISLALH